jgi:hypothetical protein
MLTTKRPSLKKDVKIFLKLSSSRRQRKLGGDELANMLINANKRLYTKL